MHLNIDGDSLGVLFSAPGSQEETGAQDEAYIAERGSKAIG
jgi:hypothetical protein